MAVSHCARWCHHGVLERLHRQRTSVERQRAEERALAGVACFATHAVFCELRRSYILFHLILSRHGSPCSARTHCEPESAHSGAPGWQNTVPKLRQTVSNAPEPLIDAVCAHTWHDKATPLHSMVNSTRFATRVSREFDNSFLRALEGVASPVHRVALCTMA